MRVIVTGGAGFIGSHLVHKLLDEGHEVTVLDDLSTGKRHNLPGHPRLKLVIGDVADVEAVRSALQGQDVVFHLAAVASVQASIDDPLRTQRTNLQGSVTLMEAAKQAGVQRFLFASSAAVYGDAENLPISESLKPKPMSPYAADKLAAEHYLAHYHRQGWLSGTVFRFFNVFGPRQDPSSPYSGVISIFAERSGRQQGVTIYGDGRQTRDFVFVRDLVDVLYNSLDWPREQELPVVNIGRGKQVSLLQLLDTIESIIGMPITRTFEADRPGDIRYSQADIEQLERRVDHFSSASLEEGLRELLQDMSVRA